MKAVNISGYQPPQGASSNAAPSASPANPMPPQQQQAGGGGGAPVKRYSAVGDSFGLLGLQPVVSQQAEHQDAANILKLTRGFDLGQLALVVTQQEPLHPSMASLWSDTPFVIQPEFRLPSCYSVQSPKLNFQIFQKFQVETLFYVFYSMPRDVLQVAAATELNQREWRYHKTLQVWLTKVPKKAPTVQNAQFEKGTYKFFEPSTWSYVERDDFTLEYAQLEEMKVPQPQQQQQQAAAAAPVAPPAAAAVAKTAVAPGAAK